MAQCLELVVVVDYDTNRMSMSSPTGTVPTDGSTGG
jgi:hypothetical protein